MKHAFEGIYEGQIRIKLRKENSRIFFEMCDNGVGMPEEQEVDIENSMGMTLIKTLSKQLGATYELDTSHGTCYRFTFEKKENEKFDGPEKAKLIKAVESV